MPSPREHDGETGRRSNSFKDKEEVEKAPLSGACCDELITLDVKSLQSGKRFEYAHSNQAVAKCARSHSSVSMSPFQDSALKRNAVL